MITDTLFRSENISYDVKTHTLKFVYYQVETCVTKFQRDFKCLVMFATLIKHCLSGWFFMLVCLFVRFPLSLLLTALHAQTRAM